MLTAKTVKQAKPSAKQYDLSDGGGLYLRVYPSGARSWIYRCKVNGRPERVVLGRVPDMSLAEAREAAARSRKLARAGTSPAAEAQRIKHERHVMPTVEGFAAEYIRLHAKPNKRSWKADEAMLANWVTPRIGKLKLSDIHRRDVVAIVDAVREAGNTRQPGKVFAVVSRMFKFAVERGVLEMSPAIHVSVSQPKSQTRALTADEILRWWHGTEDPAMGGPAGRLALRLMLLTGQRPGEVGGLRIDELDLDAAVWNLPGDRRKKGNPHRVPLSGAAIAVIREAKDICAKDGYLFAKAKGTGGVGSDGVVKYALKRIFAGADYKATPHDARRTVATEMSEMGVSEEAIAAVLGHQPRTVTQSYIKRRLRMARGPLDAWARRLELLLAGNPGANVVALREW